MNDLTTTDTARALSFIAGIADNYSFARRDFLRWVEGKPLNVETVGEYLGALFKSW